MPEFLDIKLMMILNERQRYIQMLLQFTYDLQQVEKLKRPFALLALKACSLSIARKDNTPLVSLQEIRAYLKRYRSDLSEKEQDDLCSTYKYYYKAPENVCPRSLRHLSRCAIRNAIHYNGNRDDRIDNLDLPPALKSYLHLLW